MKMIGRKKRQNICKIIDLGIYPWKKCKLKQVLFIQGSGRADREWFFQKYVYRRVIPG